MRCCLTEQLLNQLDGAGPPPASKDQIDALPSTTIDQEQVGELILPKTACYAPAHMAGALAMMRV